MTKNTLITQEQIAALAKQKIAELERELDGTPYYICSKTANEMIGFITHLKHTKGKFAGKNFQLLPFQIKFLLNAICVKKRSDGLRRYRIALLMIPRKNGKALSLDTDIPTPYGWIKMRNIKAGDIVYDEQGKKTTVTYVSPVMQNHECYDIYFSDGTKITADKEHIWTVQSAYHNRKTTNLTTKQMLDFGINKPRNDKKMERAFAVNVPKAIDGEPKELTIHPYLLGLWLGDGSNYDARITIGSYKNEIILNLKNIGCDIDLVPSSQNDAAQVFNIRTAPKRCKDKRSFNRQLRELNLIKNKHIPSDYLFAPISDRKKLLKGLFDSDGHINKNGECEYSSKSERLANDVALLCRSLGYKTSIYKHKAKIYSKDYGFRYRVSFFAVKGDMNKNNDRLKISTAKRNRTKQIISIKPTNSVEVKCIQVDSPSSLFLAGDGFTPTHNTEIIAAVLNYFLFVDEEKGKDIYCAANETDQASIIFNATKSMIVQDTRLSAHCNIWRSTKTIERKGGFHSFVKVLTANADTKDGLNPYVFVYDELHAAKDGNLFNVLEEGTVGREQPLTFIISTAGYNHQGVMKQKYDYAKKVASGIIKDDTFYSMIFELGEDDIANEGWKKEENWEKVNPALGYGVTLDGLRSQFTKALESGEEEVAFKTKHLNMWTNASRVWIKDEVWTLLNPSACSLTEGRECYAGLDLSSTTDISSLIAIFPNPDGSFDTLRRYYIPEDNMRSRVRRDRVPYIDWHNKGYITTTPGNVIDYDYIEKDILFIAEKFRLKLLNYDRFMATQIITHLSDEGIEVNGFGQGFVSMNAPTKMLETLVLQGKINHENDPVLRWMISNVELQMDAAGNVKCDKGKSRDKIDGVVALIMSIGGWILNKKEEITHPYNERGVIFF
ncbi:MAG: terminase large subunit [Campylobacteraceae bacterium]|jgi:phage terminase large subunit-like protein|nr:terminase large subunit [Campylobacteraceae bacterium]